MLHSLNPDAEARFLSETTVVIGSNSFSGAHYVDHLLESGEQVVAISRSEPPSPAFLPYLRHGPDAAPFHQLDVNHDLEAILDVVKQHAAPTVVNFAAQSMVAQSWDHPEHWYTTNVVGMVKLHDGLRRFPFLERYVHVSTPEVYGSCEGLVKEDAPYNPSTPYATSRAACDMSLRNFFDTYGFPVVFTRAANVFGPGQQLYRIVPRTILYILLGRTLQLHGGGHSLRSFISIRDVADGTLRVARRGEPGAVYHLSTDRHIAIRDVVGEICRQMGTSFEDVVEIGDDRPGKDAAYLLDSSRARDELGWRPEQSFEDVVGETIEWVRKHLDELKAQPLDYIHQP
jgi:dTDP-glucose 4,6-dehydratase